MIHLFVFIKKNRKISKLHYQYNLPIHHNTTIMPQKHITFRPDDLRTKESSAKYHKIHPMYRLFLPVCD
jgi:hypothetical protein